MWNITRLKWEMLHALTTITTATAKSHCSRLTTAGDIEAGKVGNF